MQQNIKCKWLHKSFVFLLSILVATSFMVPGSFGAFGVQEASAADDVVVLDETWLNYDEIGSTGTCKIYQMRYEPGVTPKRIEIPAAIDGLVVKEIDANAFASKGLTYVKFADSSTVEKIGENAFKGNAITTIESNGPSDPTTLPTTVKEIGKASFSDNSIGTLNLENLEDLKDIPDQAFAHNAVNNIKLPKKLETIGTNAFNGSRFTSIKFPETLTSVGFNAFYNNNTGLKIDASLHEPNSIKWAPWHAEYADVKWMDTNNEDSTYNSAFLFDKEQRMIYGLKESIATTNYRDWDNTNGAGRLKIPAKIGTTPVEHIADYAVAGNATRGLIKEIDFEAGSAVDSIPSSFALRLAKLESITNVPSTVKTVGSNAFLWTDLLKEIKLPGVTKLDDSAFYFARGLEKITFDSDAVTEFGASAFRGCDKLTAIELKKMKKGSVKNPLAGATYAKVYWLNGEITEPTVKMEEDISGDWKVDPDRGWIIRYVGSEDNLVVPNEVTIPGREKPVKITRVGDGGTTTIMYENAKNSYSSVKISAGITKVDKHAFHNTIIGSLDLGAEDKDCVLRVVELDAFRLSRCGNVKLPASLTTIGGGAFFGCNMSNQVTLPGNLTSVASDAFSGNPNISSFLVKQYLYTDTDEGAYNDEAGLYKRSLAAVFTNGPWGATQAAGQIYYMDEARLVGRHEVVQDSTNNKVKIEFRGYTNDNFYIVKNIAAVSGMPALENVSYPTAQGMRRPATADMTVESTTKTVSGKKVQGGNGTYKVNMTFGSQIPGSTIPNKTSPYDVEINDFHTLTYDSNAGGKAVSGSAPTAPEPYLAGHKPALQGAGTMAIAGYTFKGWTANKNGANPVYTAGSRNWEMPDSNATLYAKWDANTYKVKFDGNGGKFGTAATKEINGKTDQDFTNLSGYAVPEKEGYVFQGWSKQSGDSNTVNISSVPAENTTVYAVWKAGTGISVAFNGNGGKFGSKETNICTGTVDTDLTSMPNYAVPTREGYTFKGWATTNNATAANITKVPTKSGVVYAVWQINKYDVTFNGNSGTIGGAATKKINDEYNKDLTKMTGYVAPIREGYNFRGWATSAGATTPNITTVPAKAQTVYAVWSIKNDIKVTLDANGGKFEVADKETLTEERAVYGTKFSNLFVYEEPVLKYYTFKGWATTADAAAPNATTVPAANTTVYAVWEETPATDAEKDAFRSEIEAVKKDAEETKVSTDGKDVSEKEQWVPKEEKDKIDKAATDAEAVLNAAGVTGKQIAEGSEALKASKDEFDKAKKEGSKETADAEAALAKAKSDAKAELDKVDVNIYEEPEKSTVIKAVDDGKKEIDASTTIPQVDAAKKKALDTIAAQKTAAQKQAERDAEQKQAEDPKNIPTEVTDKTPANLVAVTTAITTAKNDGDLKGSTYAPLKFQSKKQTKKNIKLQWSKVKGAKQYTVYANQCGVKNKYKKLATVKGKTLNVKKVAGKKLKKGANYKFLIIAENGDKVSAISKTLHIRTAGHKKYTNYKSVSVKKTVIKKAKKLKKGKTLKLNAKGVVPKGKKVSVHVKTRYESANKKVATVTKAGKVKGNKKGKAKIYCYVQNGLAKVVTVTVK